MNLLQLKRLGALASSVLVGVLVANTAAAENGPNYTFLEAGYDHVEIDDFDADGDALAFEGSFAVTDMFHVVGAYQDGSIDSDLDIDIDISTIELGGGMNFALSPTVDLVGQATWISTEVDASGFGDVDEDGFGVGAGVRAMLMPQFEVGAGINYTDVVDGETSFAGKVVYYITDVFAMTGGVTFAEDATTYGIGLRANFQGM